MKNLKVVLLIVGVFFITNVVNAQDKKQKKNETVKYWVSMDCAGCKAKVEKNIAYEKGIKDLVVDLETKTVTINYKTKKTDPQKIEKALQELGFKTEKLAIEEKVETKKKSK